MEPIQKVQPAGSFVVEETPKPPIQAPIYDIQGPGDRSPLEGKIVMTTGIVTLVTAKGFYVQDAKGDGKDNTSDAIFVYLGNPPPTKKGDLVEVVGKVVEFVPNFIADDGSNASKYDLPFTQIAGNATVKVISSNNPLPPPVVLGAGGRMLPTENLKDGIDVYESLEGMRVQVNRARVVGPTHRQTFVVVGDQGKHATGLSKRGGLRASKGDGNPERVIVEAHPTLMGEEEDPNNRKPKLLLNVGDEIDTVVGVMTYQRSAYKLLASEKFKDIKRGNLKAEITTLVGDETHMTVASFNMHNLDPKVEDKSKLVQGGTVDDDIKSGQYDNLTTQIIENLKLPDVLMHQEIQDNDGSESTEEVDDHETIRELVERIKAKSGVEYAWVSRSPEKGQDGGQPGGNIRVGYLYRKDRVSLVEGSVERIGAGNSAFKNTRKSLAADFIFNKTGKKARLINNHLTSKRGGSPDFGTLQPPTNGGVEARNNQAAVVNDYMQKAHSAGTSRIISMGDFNEMEFNSPTEIMARNGFVNVVQKFSTKEPYSYNFMGVSQQLDQCIISEELAETAEFETVRTNSDFAEPLQATDHNPTIVRVDMASDLAKKERQKPKRAVEKSIRRAFARTA